MPIMRLVLGLMRGFGALPRHFKAFIIAAAVVFMTLGSVVKFPVGLASTILAVRDGLSRLANPIARLIDSLTNADWGSFKGLIIGALVVALLWFVKMFFGGPWARVASPERARRARQTRSNLSGTR